MGHSHIGADGNELFHTHADEQGEVHHKHVHTPEENKAVLNRISRAIGHLESIKKMVEDGRDCSEVLVQLSAVKSAINNTGKVILKNHIDHCLVEAVQSGEWEIVNELTDAIDRFIK